LTAQGVWFVTRQKDPSVYDAVEERPIPAQGRVERDQVIRLTGVGAAEKCPHDLRRIEVYDPEKDETLVFLTNHLTFGATTIATIYKDRWQIELFFKALKQNLKIKTFVGTSANALKVQVWTALIAMLILKYLQLKARFAWSLSNLVALLRMNLFTHRDLWTWLDRPFEGPPAVLVTTQEELALGYYNRDSRTGEPHLGRGPGSSNSPGNREVSGRDRRQFGQQWFRMISCHRGEAMFTVALRQVRLADRKAHPRAH
jgi:hypothetical protein